VPTYHRVLVSAALASVCAITTPTSAAVFKVPEGFKLPEGWFHFWETLTEPVSKTPVKPEAPVQDPTKVNGTPSTPSNNVLCCVDPIQGFHDSFSRDLIAVWRSNRLKSSYHPDAVDSINDPYIRVRVANSLQRQTLYNIAVFSGRERQFRYVARTAKITWTRNEVFRVKAFPNSSINAKFNDVDVSSLFKEPLQRRVDDLRVKIGIFNELESYISEASDRVNPSDFATQAQ
jgi:hypothetical protein